MKQEFVLYLNTHGSCPYLDNREWVTLNFSTDEMAPAVYERMISNGFRRSGNIFYQNHCENCEACRPIRIDVQRFSPSTSQRRVWRKNRDVMMSRHPVSFTPEDFALYRTYVQHRHPTSPQPDEEGYLRFLIDSLVSTEIMRYSLGGRVAGLGWIDVLPHSISSVYFAFDPEFSSRSLGTLSILRQIALAKELGKQWLHLGFWVKERGNMAYKSHFTPCQILVNDEWQEL